MFFFKSIGAKPARAGPPSPILQFIAGEFAARIAAFWPEPHAAFLTSPACRRHLVCLALVHGRAQGAGEMDGLLNRSLKRAITIAVPSAPAGLSRALERMGECAWSEAEYRSILRLLAGHHTGKVLRHREHIDAGSVQAMALLPEILLEQGISRLELSPPVAGLVAEAFEAISRRDGMEVALALAPRWAAAGSFKALGETVSEDLEPEPQAPPFPGSDRLRPLASKASIIDAASRYKNCLRNYLRWAAEGRSAFYEWLGDPGAVIELTNDRVFGWGLDEAKLANNEPIPEPTRSAIVAELRRLGVYVGRPSWQLFRTFDEHEAHRAEPIQTEAEAIGSLFGD